jgi:hypothetical protein
MFNPIAIGIVFQEAFELEPEMALNNLLLARLDKMVLLNKCSVIEDEIQPTDVVEIRIDPDPNNGGFFGGEQIVMNSAKHGCHGY